MLRSSLALIDTMGTVGITHHLEHFAIFYQFIDQAFCVLIMYIVISRAVNEQ